MARSPTLGTSVVLLLASLMISAVLFGGLLPNHWIAFVLLPIIAALLYYGALTAFYFLSEDHLREA